MKVPNGVNRGIIIEGQRWEGYCQELIDQIAKLLNFKYEFEVIQGIGYGSYNEETKSWDGLIKRLLDRVRKHFNAFDKLLIIIVHYSVSRNKATKQM